MTSAKTLPTDRAAVVATVDPDVLTATTWPSDYIDMAKFGSIMAIVMAGAMVATSTIDAILQQATDSGGTGVKAITGKLITQLTAAGSDDDKQAIMNLREDEMDVAGGFTHARLLITVGTASTDGGGIVLGFDPRHGPASDNDLASVDEIVT